MGLLGHRSIGADVRAHLARRRVAIRRSGCGTEWHAPNRRGALAEHGVAGGTGACPRWAYQTPFASHMPSTHMGAVGLLPVASANPVPMHISAGRDSILDVFRIGVPR